MSAGRGEQSSHRFSEIDRLKCFPSLSEIEEEEEHVHEAVMLCGNETIPEQSAELCSLVSMNVSCTMASNSDDVIFSITGDRTSFWYPETDSS